MGRVAKASTGLIKRRKAMNRSPFTVFLTNDVIMILAVESARQAKPINDLVEEAIIKVYRSEQSTGKPDLDQPVRVVTGPRETRRFNVNFPTRYKEALRRMAQLQSASMADVLRDAIDLYQEKVDAFEEGKVICRLASDGKVLQTFTSMSALIREAKHATSM
jgi:hypothetical protein